MTTDFEGTFTLPNQILDVQISKNGSISIKTCHFSCYRLSVPCASRLLKNWKTDRFTAHFILVFDVIMGYYKSSSIELILHHGLWLLSYKLCPCP